MISKILAFPAVWFIFFIGHLSSKMLNLIDNTWWAYFWYPIYNGLMILSIYIQEKVGGRGKRWPWQ